MDSQDPNCIQGSNHNDGNTNNRVVNNSNFYGPVFNFHCVQPGQYEFSVRCLANETSQSSTTEQKSRYKPSKGEPGCTPFPSQSLMGEPDIESDDSDTQFQDAILPKIAESIRKKGKNTLKRSAYNPVLYPLKVKKIAHITPRNHQLDKEAP